MADPTDALILDLLEWIGPRPRAYADVMDAWRTSCPRFTVWEDANERGLVAPERRDDVGIVVVVTPRGRRFLDEHRPQRPRA